MKVITLTQPFATLIAIGSKRIETRSWAVGYRGPLAIHASKEWTKEIAKLTMSEPFRSALSNGGYSLPSRLPLGSIIATTRLIAIYEIVSSNYRDGVAFVRGQPFLECDRHVELPPVSPEWFFGNYAPGRYMWFLEDVKSIGPITIRGSLGLWNCNLI